MSLALDYTGLRLRIADRLGLGRTAGSWSSDESARLDEILESGLRNFYFPDPLEPGRPAHCWSFLKPIGEMTTTAPYSTGTIEIADGVVTLTDGTWPAAAASGELIANGRAYTIASRDGDTQITLDDTSIDLAAGTSYTLGFPYYDLPTTYGGINGPITFSPGLNYYYPPLSRTSEGTLRVTRQAVAEVSIPKQYATRAKPFVATVGQRHELILWPTPDAAYQLFYPYLVVPVALTAEAPYPLGGPEHAETILESCLAVAEQRLNDMTGIHTANFMRRLAASIEFDRRQSTPDTLGYNADRSDRVDAYCNRQIDPNSIFTYEGLY